MSTTTPSQKKTAAESHELPSDALTLGVDGEGVTHRYSRIAHAVVVETPAGHIEERIELRDRTLSQYIAYVDGLRGWARLNYASTFGDVLRDALAASGNQEADR